jgi:phosphomevalonate kinase
VKISAPGKLVIAGEYAVLEGHPALVTAVDRRAVLDVNDADQLCLARGGETPQIPIPLARAREVAGLELLVAVADEIERRGWPLPPVAARLDTDAFFEKGGDKLGLGSSAAGAVCLSALFLSEHLSVPVGGLDPRALFELALEAHRRFNRGGSGVDLAASTWGGTFVFRREGERVGVTPTKLVPDGIELLAVHTGKAQKTTGFLKATSTLKAREPGRYHDLLHEIAEAARAVIDAWAPAELLEGFRRSRLAMAALGEAAVISIVSPLHEEIARVARSFEAEAKPSGAGGGDFALVATRVGQRKELMTALSQAGFKTIDLGFGATGVRADG